jgi:clathrin heavy chain
VNKLQDLQRGHEYANNINTSDLWTLLGTAHLQKEDTLESIQCFLKARHSGEYLQVIFQAEQNKLYEQLVAYLLMARDHMKDTAVDNSLAYCYANLAKVAELEELLGDSNSVDVLRVGDRCFDNQMYEPARVLYS